MAFIVPVLAEIGGGSAVAGGLALAGTAVSALGANSQAKYQAKVAENNAAIAEQNAIKASEAAQLEQQRSDFAYGDLMSQQLSAQSASGLDAFSSSQLKVRDLSRRVRGQAATDIRRQGEANTANLFQDAANFKGEANAARAQGNLALLEGALKIGGAVAEGMKKKSPKGSLIGSTRTGSAKPWSKSANWSAP